MLKSLSPMDTGQEVLVEQVEPQPLLKQVQVDNLE
jgi:hypothetical protein